MAQQDILEAQQCLGELFLMGFSGTSLPSSTAAFIHSAGIGGVILFKHNYTNLTQLAQLTRVLQGLRSNSPLWISADQEGGRVQRFREPFPRFPTAEAVGKQQSPQLAYDVSFLMAQALKKLGINLNFAPVADILSEPTNPVIGDRAFGTDAETVGKMVSAFVRGHLTAGVQPCLKHFPGHGDTQLDSHFALPRVETPLSVLRAREFVPFVRGIRSKCRMVMTAHILAPSVDDQMPATLSHRWLNEVLREELRFSGVIISDDLEMKAVADRFGPADLAVAAIQAGCDLLCIRTEEFAQKAYEGCYVALKEGRLDPRRVLESANRLRSIKQDVLTDEIIPDADAAMELLNRPESQQLLKKFV